MNNQGSFPPNQDPNYNPQSVPRRKKPKLLLILLFIYVLIIGVSFVKFFFTHEYSSLKTAADLSIVARFIFPEQYQLVVDRAMMEKEYSVGVMIYYKDYDDDGSVIFREIRELPPGYHVITPPEYCGNKRYYMKSENRVNVDANGHATPNVLHFYYTDED